jgi:hypothetical protein
VLEFDAKNLTVNQLIAFEEYGEKMRTGRLSMLDVRDLIAILLRKDAEWVGENVTAAEMQTIMGDIGHKIPGVVQNAVPLATSGALSPTPTATDTARPDGYLS